MADAEDDKELPPGVFIQLSQPLPRQQSNAVLQSGITVVPPPMPLLDEAGAPITDESGDPIEGKDAKVVLQGVAAVGQAGQLGTSGVVRRYPRELELPVSRVLVSHLTSCVRAIPPLKS